MPNKVWLLWYDNQLDEPMFLSVHATKASAKVAAKKRAAEQGCRAFLHILETELHNYA